MRHFGQNTENRPKVNNSTNRFFTRGKMMPLTCSSQWDHPNPSLYSNQLILFGMHQKPINHQHFKYFGLSFAFGQRRASMIHMSQCFDLIRNVCIVVVVVPVPVCPSHPGLALTLAASCIWGPDQGHGLGCIAFRVDVAPSLPLRRELCAALGCGWRLLGYHCWFLPHGPLGFLLRRLLPTAGPGWPAKVG